MDVQFYYIKLLEKGAVLSERLPIIWAKRFPTNEELLRFNLYCEDKLDEIIFGGEEDFTLGTYKYLDLLDDYFASKQIDYYKWRDEFRAAIANERAERVAFYQAKLDALPKYPDKENGELLPDSLRYDLIALDKDFPGEYPFTKDALYPGRYFYLSQIWSFEEKVKRLRKS